MEIKNFFLKEFQKFAGFHLQDILINLRMNTADKLCQMWHIPEVLDYRHYKLCCLGIMSTVIQLLWRCQVGVGLYEQRVETVTGRGVDWP